MKWKNSHTDPPVSGSVVYYFGKNIGIWVGYYNYKQNSIKSGDKTIELCPHLFSPLNGFGLVDACDAPYWFPYSAEREQEGWRPIIPESYTKDLYDNAEPEIKPAYVDSSHQ